MVGVYLFLGGELIRIGVMIMIDGFIGIREVGLCFRVVRSDCCCSFR